MANFAELYQAKFSDISEMSKDELAEELQLFRNLWTWIPEDYKYWLAHIGSRIRLVRRDYHAFIGTLGSTHWKMEQIEIEVIEPLYNYDRGTKTWEVKTVVMPLSQIVDYQIIHSEEVEVIKGEPEDRDKVLEAMEVDLG